MDKDEVVPGTAPEPTDWEALARFLAGESPPREADAVRGWLAENPDRQAVLDALDRAMHRGATPPPGDLDVDAALAAVHRRMDAPAPPVVPAPRPPSTRTRRGWGSPVLRVAVMLLLLLGGWFGWRVVRGGPPLMVTAYATEVGERQTVRLPDGTTVLLGPASRVTLPRAYGRRERTVELLGEAMFDVPHDDARPFTVRAGGARVRDIGTAFSVQTGPAGVRVVVTEGAVALAPARGGGEVVLRQGERGVLAREGAAPERAAATTEDLAWTRGELVFRDAPLAQVEAELRRWYGVELRADDAVAARRLTASFQGEPRERVLEVVALALGAEIRVRGDTAVLAAAGAAP